MNASRAVPAGIIFDLFGTLVSIDVELLPRDESSGQFATIAGLDELLAELSPRLEVADFGLRMMEVSREIFRDKAKKNIEISSSERFRMALQAMELSGDLAAVALQMSERHMNSLLNAVVCPPGRADLLGGLAARFSLALLSNFDHAVAARKVLERAGLLDYFDCVVISDDLGIRKPAAEIFLHACRGLSLDASVCLHVGDSHAEDIEGAAGAGLSALWVNADGGEPRPALDSIADVSALPAWLAAHYADES